MTSRWSLAFRRAVAVFVALFGVLMLVAVSRQWSSSLCWEGVALLLLWLPYWYGKRAAYFGVAVVALLEANKYFHAFRAIYGMEHDPDTILLLAQLLGMAAVWMVIAIGSLVQCVRRRAARNDDAVPAHNGA